MKPIIPMSSTAIGALLGSLYGFLSMLATIPALIASEDISVPDSFTDVYQSRYFYMLLPLLLIIGTGIGKWRAGQIGNLGSWRRRAALILLGLILAVLGYEASIVLFFIAV